MTPKEKAEQLVDKYYEQLFTSDFREIEAKQCALICVDEMINQLLILKESETEIPTIYLISRKIYLEVVKQEIEKI